MNSLSITARTQARRLRCIVLWLAFLAQTPGYAVDPAPRRTYSTHSYHLQSRLEQEMFLDSAHAVLFRTHCGHDWHRLFLAWEARQRQAIRNDPTAKAIVWKCEFPCGGLGDRIRGILTSFTLALVTDRAFFIDHPTPVLLHQFFHAAHPELHWVFFDELTRDRSVLLERFDSGTPSIGDYGSANLSFYDQYDVVVQHNTYPKPFGILQNPALSSDLVDGLQSLDEHILAGCMMSYLLVPNLELQYRVNNVTKELVDKHKSLLAVQVRTGDNQVKDRSVLESLFGIFETCISQIQHASEHAYRLFVTSDSDEVMELFLAAFPDALTNPGSIMHIDGVWGNADQVSFGKLVLDHLMISQGEELVISRSGFSEYAALRGFKPYRKPLRCAMPRHFVFSEEIQWPVPTDITHSIDDLLPWL